MARAKQATDQSRRTSRKRRKTDTNAEEALGKLNLDFSGAPTTWEFLHDNSFVRGLMGPVGSGKSYGCAAEIMLRAVKQPPSPKDGVRYSRFVIVRNSYP